MFLSGKNVGANRLSDSKKNQSSTKDILMEKMTPILYVESIESCLNFWVDDLGFTKTAEVPDGDKLGFVILTFGNLEIMLQSFASLDKDIPNLGKEIRGAPSVLYIEVQNITEVETRLKNYEVIVPKRKTFYGASEIFYRTPGGHIIGFAQQKAD
jgi:uncharacterized glyoxalase superfamily protein PhnB